MLKGFVLALSIGTLGVVVSCSGSGGDDPTSPGDGGSDTGGPGDGGSAPGDGGANQGQGGSAPGDGGADQGQGGSAPGEGGSAAGQAGDKGQGGTGPDPSGDIPAELVGIWQQTRASAGDYMNAYGQNFSITSGFSVELRIRETGEYYFAHSASGVRDCGQVTYLDHSTGFAVLDGTTLVLQPTEHVLERLDCAISGEQTLPNDPITFSIGLEESSHFYSGLRTYQMNVEGGPHPFELTLLHRPPLADPEQPEQPADFVLGSSGPFEEMQGLWVADTGTDSDFFDPSTGMFYFPELNGSPHQWIRFEGAAYETAVALQNINDEGACKSDIIYYEQGEARFEALEDVGGQGSHFVGHALLAATAARLIVNVRECAPDNQVLTYDLPPQQSYYRWIFFTAASANESITMDCGTFPKSEWQSTLCRNDLTGFRRR